MSPSRETRRPIERITLKVKVEGERSELAALQKKLVRAKVSNKTLTHLIETEDPSEALSELHALGDALRLVEKNPKGFKQS